MRGCPIEWCTDWSIGCAAAELQWAPAVVTADADGPAPTHCTVPSLRGDRAYQFRVRAANTHGAHQCLLSAPARCHTVAAHSVLNIGFGRSMERDAAAASVALRREVSVTNDAHACGMCGIDKHACALTGCSRTL